MDHDRTHKYRVFVKPKLFLFLYQAVYNIKFRLRNTPIKIFTETLNFTILYKTKFGWENKHLTTDAFFQFNFHKSRFVNYLNKYDRNKIINIILNKKYNIKKKHYFYINKESRFALRKIEK